MSTQRAQRTRSRQDDSGIPEAYRSLRATVKFATGERAIRSVLVVDVDRRRPSMVAEQLATAFAEAGDTCALIDTDARSNIDRDHGFFDLLAGSASAESVGRMSESGGLIHVPAGMSGSPDALAGSRLGEAVERLVDAFGIAIFSSAPLPQYADALAIAPRVDAVIMVVTSGGTRRPRAIDARDALDRVGARILGVVMVQEKQRRYW